MKKTKVVIICLMMGVLLLMAGCVGEVMAGRRNEGKEYDSIVEKWKDKTVFEKEASEDAINALLKAAEAKDREEFAENFSDVIRSEEGFDNRVDDFLSAFPAGLSKAELKYNGGGAGGSSGEDWVRKGAAYNYVCTLDGEWYLVTVSFCFRNDKHPEEIGVEEFVIMNKNARAYHIQMASKDPEYFDGIDLLCDVRSEEETPARLIGGTPYLWTESGYSKHTEDEMRELLNLYGTLNNRALRGMIGPANVIYKAFNSTGHVHCYELQPENDEPRYAYIVCQTEYGKIYYAYVCTSDETLYDDPLYESK